MWTGREGWKRSFVLRTWGYCKDCAPFTATGDTVEPLPFKAMRTYPYGPDEHYPRDALHEDSVLRVLLDHVPGPDHEHCISVVRRPKCDHERERKRGHGKLHQCA